MNPQILANQINEKGHLTIGGEEKIELAQKYGTKQEVYDLEQIHKKMSAVL